MPKATIVVPSFNVSATLAETLRSLEAQAYQDFEVLIVNDGSTDNTSAVAAPFLKDSRFRLIEQSNRGLAGARNRGISEAKGDFIGFCDADDLWEPEKLLRHVRHLESRVTVGVSYSGSKLIDAQSNVMRFCQRPKLHNITAADILKRNPIGNGSSAVFRRDVFRDIGYIHHENVSGLCYFDECFRQSEDIECWLRIALTTDWIFEGIAGTLTRYRIVGGGLSAQTERQLASWENAIRKLRPLDPAFFAAHEAAARAYQFRYLARRAVSGGEGRLAWAYAKHALKCSKEPIWAEPVKSATTLAAAFALGISPNLRNLMRSS